MHLNVTEIPYRENSCQYAERVIDWPYPVFFDSGKPLGDQGRFDIISAAPACLLSTTNGITRMAGDDHTNLSETSPFELVTQALASYDAARSDTVDLPFTGGAIGFFGYELNSKDLAGISRPTRSSGLPDMHIGIYLWAIVQDHKLQQSWLLFHPDCEQSRQDAVVERIHRSTSSALETFKLTRQFSSNMSRDYYDRSLARINNYLLEGDCYQVNFAQRFSASFSGSPWLAYQHLREIAPAPWSAYMAIGNSAVLCFSPERFLAVRDSNVETRPIKGTRPRSSCDAEDRRLGEELLESDKDRAENLMIVDLLRNDLAKTCQINSIEVPQLFGFESYSNVHHLVSTIRGKLREDKSVLDLLEGCFPGGSITGAPKRRAMQIIQELEHDDRQVYCGSIAYIGFDGNMDSNIAIRTLLCDNEKIHCWGGGGIVADSRPDAEYQESLDKIKALLTGLEKL
jgi:para-aminobenzoate synthetase component 1